MGLVVGWATRLPVSGRMVRLVLIGFEMGFATWFLPPIEEMDIGHHIVSDPDAAAVQNGLVEVAVFVESPGLFQVYVGPARVKRCHRLVTEHAADDTLTALQVDAGVPPLRLPHHVIPSARHGVDVAEANGVKDPLDPWPEDRAAGGDAE